MGTVELRKILTAILLVGYGLLLFYLTLIFHTTQRLSLSHRFNFIPLKTIGIFLHKGGIEMVVNIVGNLAAFAPLGFLVPIFREERTSLGRVVCLCAGISLLIELLQFFTGYRVADIDDVILNTLGGVLGYAVYRLVCWTLLRTGLATDP